MGEFIKGEPVNYLTAKHGIQNDYFVRYSEDGKRGVVGPGDDTYASVCLKDLSHGHIKESTNV